MPGKEEFDHINQNEKDKIKFLNKITNKYRIEFEIKYPDKPIQGQFVVIKVPEHVKSLKSSVNSDNSSSS